MSELKVLSAKTYPKKKAPIRIMQFGEGNFLRAFMDWMIEKLNDTGTYSGHVVVVQPLPQGRVSNLAAQDGLYTVILQGLNDEKKAVKTHEIIDVLDDFINPYQEYSRFLAYGADPELNVIISNTTEAGIAYDENDVPIDMSATVPTSYPGKLLALLKKRYEALGMKGEIAIMPCELIDDNGDVLKKTLLKLAEARGEDKGFIGFISEACHFTCSLVDRIVPGFPRDEFDSLCREYGYIDNNMVKGEYFNLLVYRAEPFCEKALPLDKIGEPVHAIFVPDVHPYKQRKVRILNGAHSSLVPVAYLAGFDEVREALLDKQVSEFLTKEIFGEIVPTVHVKGADKFADDVLSRFMNPYVHHRLMSIALNSLTKFRERDLPTLLDDFKADRAYPKHLTYALANLIRFYDGKRIKNGVEEKIELNDSPAFIAFMRKAWDRYYASDDLGELAETVLGNTDIWGSDLNATAPGLTAQVVSYLSFLLSHRTPYEALTEFNAHA